MSEARTIRMGFAVSPSEYAAIERLRTEAGLGQSEYLRLRALGDEVAEGPDRSAVWAARKAEWCVPCPVCGARRGDRCRVQGPASRRINANGWHNGRWEAVPAEQRDEAARAMMARLEREAAKAPSTSTHHR